MLLGKSWFQVTLIYIVSRLITSAMMLYAMTLPVQNGHEDLSNNFFAFSTTWDGGWYQSISVNGYPSVIELGPSGHVLESSWAFLPAFPLLVNVITFLTGTSWSIAAFTIALTCGLFAAQFLYKILEDHIPKSQAIFAVVLFSVAPASPVLQVGYAESLFLMLLAILIFLVQKKRYFTALPFIAIFGFTKPGVLALSLMLVLLWIYRMVRRKVEPFPARESAGIILAASLAGITGLSWTIIAGISTGMPDAYLQTELSWRAPYIGWNALVPFTPWFQGFSWWSERLGVPGYFGSLALIVLLATSVLALFSPAMRKLGIEIRLWLFSFGLYILAVFFPQSSTFRILMPLFPALGFLAQPQSKLYRVSLVVMFLVGQWVWIYVCWIPHFPVDGTPP